MRTVSDAGGDSNALTTVRCYEILVRGIVGPTLAFALDGFTVVSTGGGESLFRGRVDDQAGLHGVLETLDRLGLELTALWCLPDEH